jgi:hypothetical protein
VVPKPPAWTGAGGAGGFRTTLVNTGGGWLPEHMVDARLVAPPHEVGAQSPLLSSILASAAARWTAWVPRFTCALLGYDAPWQRSSRCGP